MKDIFKDKVVLITGGTGSFGNKFIEIAVERYKPRRLIVFSRDEIKQYEMRGRFPQNKNIRYFIGDVRDSDRLRRAFHGVDIVVHAAALKIVPTAEYNPFEVVKTNIIGAENVINVAIDSGVKKVIALSSDKACNPVNLYGATKLCSDKLFIAGNAYAGTTGTRFSVVRYGNVAGSRGSVIPFFTEKAKDGVIPITDEGMTRFLITLEETVDFVIKCFSVMHGGELFVPKIPSVRIIDLARIMAPKAKIKVIGIRPGEKLHEVMVSEDDARNTLEFKDYYIVKPSFPWWKDKNHSGGKKVPNGFRYASNNNKEWLEGKRLKRFLKSV